MVQSLSMSISSPFNPASPQALDTLRLFILVLILMAGVFVVVTGVVVYAVFRFRSQPGQGDPPQDTGEPRREFLWIGRRPSDVGADDLANPQRGSQYARVCGECDARATGRPPRLLEIAHRAHVEGASVAISPSR